jgi:hypothetical protein
MSDPHHVAARAESGRGLCPKDVRLELEFDGRVNTYFIFEHVDGTAHFVITSGRSRNWLGGYEISIKKITHMGLCHQWLLALLPHCNTNEELEAAIVAKLRMKG